jgi:uncharacterized lipoprotein YbaY/heat shock protein HslJ
MKCATALLASLSLIFLYACNAEDNVSGSLASESGTSYITGTVSFRERMALSPKAALEIQLQDVSRQDTKAIQIAKQRIENPGQVPIEFKLEFDSSKIDERMSYSISARLYEGDKLEFVTAENVSVLTRGGGSNVDILLQRVPEYSFRFKGKALPKKKPEAKPKPPAGIELQGFFKYMADTALFRDCRNNRSFPVAMEGQYIELERAYLSSGVEPGAELMVALSGRYLERKDMEGNRSKVSLIVDTFHNLLDENECSYDTQAELLGTYWKLVHLGDRGVSTPEGAREAHMVLHEENLRVSGNAGCNDFFGHFTRELEKISFSALGSTMMACPEGLDTEQDFLKALERTTHFTIEGEILELFVDDESLARLEAVYL